MSIPVLFVLLPILVIIILCISLKYLCYAGVKGAVAEDWFFCGHCGHCTALVLPPTAGACPGGRIRTLPIRTLPIRTLTLPIRALPKMTHRLRPRRSPRPLRWGVAGAVAIRRCRSWWIVKLLVFKPLPELVQTSAPGGELPQELALGHGCRDVGGLLDGEEPLVCIAAVHPDPEYS